ncbi:DUF485 domain-containing protein [Erysipelotrichaceae bacterium Oil+RF-744-GAM-WT-6]|uniref:DUF485 domain-containing protein n=1 Tax=Stecheria intestinalis TaxID=2606630 RepID=A0A7X2TF00_9FIRM|nr:DUF485 domain-containing protein [Stecheria intestinalis]MSS58097.1 DUF485 domain-containing protein [Stecheria intestinalis]
MLGELIVIALVFVLAYIYSRSAGKHLDKMNDNYRKK